MSGGILFIESGAELQRRVYREGSRVCWADALPVVLEKHGLLGVETAGPEALSDPERLAGADVVLVARLPEECWSADALEAVGSSQVPVLLDGPLPEPVAPRLRITLGERAVPHEGAILTIRDDELRGLAERLAAGPGGRLSGPTVRGLQFPPELLWTALPDVPLTEAQARAWATIPADPQAWSDIDQARCLCDFAGEATGPAIVQAGNLVACAFDLFGLLAHRHSAEPILAPEWRVLPRTLGLETTLVALVDLLHRQARRTRPRLLPWPHSATMVVVRREPMDVAVTQEVLEARLRELSEQDQGATWFWAPSAIDPDQVKTVAAAPHQEVALDAELLWGGGDEEPGALRGAGAGELAGMSARPSPSYFRYQGAPNVLWAERAGVRYVDLPARGHLHPHRFPALEQDGSIRLAPVLCVPGTESLPLLRRSGLLADRITEYRRARGLMCLEDPLRSRAAVTVGESAEQEPPVDAELADGAESAITSWTLRDAVDWWAATHVLGAIELKTEAGSWVITARRRVEGMTLELLNPDGEAELHTIDLDERPRRILSGTVDAADRPGGWEEAFPAVEEALSPELERRSDVTTPAERAATVAAQTTGISRQRVYMAQLLRELTGREGWEGLTVLIPQASYGTLGCALAIEDSPHLVINLESNVNAFKVAENLVQTARLEEAVETIEGELTSLPTLTDGCVDVVLATNALHRFAPGRELSKTLKEARRVLRPDGHLLVYETLSRGDSAAGGERDLPLQDLRRALKRAGLREERAIAYGREGRVDPGDASAQITSYALAAARAKPGKATRSTRRRPRPEPQLDTWVWTPEQLGEVFSSHISAAWVAEGRDVNSPASQTTLRVNSLLVPGRGDHLLRLMAQLLGRETLRGLRVLEVGSGYGALAAYMAWHERPNQLVGLDVREDFVELANRCSRELRLEPILTYVTGDMTDLSRFGDGEFDLIFANNAFLYVATRHSAKRALSEFHRTLDDRGELLLYQANLWRYREPFSGAPLMHLLPTRAARLVHRLTGLEHNHGRVKLLSPPGMRRSLRTSGFESTAPVSFRHGPVTRWPGRNFGSFFAMGAKKG